VFQERFCIVTILKIPFLLLIVFLLTAMSSFGDEFAGTGSRWPVAQIKSIATDSSTDYVFIGDGDTLNVFRKSDFLRVAHLRFKNTTEGVRALVYYSNGTTKVVYAACGYSGVQVINVGNPLEPTQEGTGQDGSGAFYTSDFGTGSGTAYVRAYDISIHGKYAYIADNTYGLRVLNLNTPLAPVEVGHRNLISSESKYYALGVDIYATGNETDVYAVMLLNSIYGPVISCIPVTGFGTNALTLDGGTATGLPTVMGSMAIQIKDRGNFETDRYAYCVDSFGNDLIIYDVLHTNIKAPQLVFSQRTGDTVVDNPLALYQPRAIDLRSIAGVGNYAYVTTYYPATNDTTGFIVEPGLNILNINNVANPIPLFKYILTGANSVKVLDDENDVYVSSQRDGIYKLNIAFDNTGNVITPVDTPSPPAYIGRKTPVNAADIRIVNNEVIFLPDNQPGSSGGLTILRVSPQVEDGAELTSSNIASPAFPVHESFLSTPGQAKAFCIKDSFENGYIADGNQGIQFVFFNEGKLTDPICVPGSNLPIETPFEVIDVDANGDNTLVALTTDPNNELWAIDVTTSTLSVDFPTDYSGNLSKADIPGDGTALKVMTYKGQSGTYAMVANGTNGLTIINLIPDPDNPVIILPATPENILHLDTQDAKSVYADPERTGIYAFVAAGQYGVKVIQLYDESNLADMVPEIIATIDTSPYGKAIDMNFFEDHLYVLTDNPDKAVLLYSLADKENPQFIGFVSSYGEGNALWATRITLPCSECTTGFSYIKGIFIADGPGGISFRQVTNENAEIEDRVWPDDKTCFISLLGHSQVHTGLFPVFVFLAFCLAFIFICAILIRGRASSHKRE
jgi:hypothetical protein